MRLKKYGVMASASLVFASFAPANSSGVSVGRNFCNCSTVVMRCFNCHFQSFQSASETSCQKPRPADWNCFRDSNELREGGSSPLADELSVSMVEWIHYKIELSSVKLTHSN